MDTSGIIFKMPPAHRPYLDEIPPPFFGFMERLKGEGFIIGVDHYFRLIKILKKVGPDVAPFKLKSLLCPLFAVNQKQQNQFYRLFDQHFSIFFVDQDTQAAWDEKNNAIREKEHSKSVSKWPYAPAAVLVILAIVFAVAYFTSQKDIKEINATRITSKTVPVEGKQTSRRKKNLKITIPIKPDRQPTTFLRQYGFKGLYWGVLAAPLIIWLFYELYRNRKKRAAVSRQKGKKPLYYWPIRVESPPTGFLKNKWFHDAARHLRRRPKSDLKCLDVEKSLSCTIAKAGYPKLCYRHLTKAPEYLLLIDHPKESDHYAPFLDALYHALLDEGIFIKRYFYSYDPRVCFKYHQGKRVF